MVVENTGGRSIESKFRYNTSGSLQYYQKVANFANFNFWGVFFTGKAQRVFVDSCLKLGGTLLEVWNPNGDKRPSSQSERDFKDDLEDFFNTASCTRFDRDIQDYYEGKSDKYRENFEDR